MVPLPDAHAWQVSAADGVRAPADDQEEYLPTSQGVIPCAPRVPTDFSKSVAL